MSVLKSRVFACLVAFALVVTLPLASCTGGVGQTGDAGSAAGGVPGQGPIGQIDGSFGGYDPDRNNSGQDSTRDPICVDGSSVSQGNGSPSSPYRSIQAALDAAENGDTIKVAGGTYREAVQISQKKVFLLGGFAGSGDFALADRQANQTVIEGTSTAPCIWVYIDVATPGELVISGFVLRGGQRGIELAGGWSGYLDNTTIENNVIEDNGTPDVERGGGISLEGNGVTVRNNLIRNNKAGRGAAIGVTDNLTDFLIIDNLIEDNTGYADHAGGVSLCGTGTVAQNVFDGNTAAASYDYGWGGALLVFGDDATTTSVSLAYNVYCNNHAPSSGGAVFVDDGATVRMEHELLYGNSSGESGSAIYVDADWNNNPSVLTMVNCTVSGHSTSAALLVQGSKASVLNCIFWDNAKDYDLIDSGSLTVNYTLMQQDCAGNGNFSADPLFADAASGDFHLQSRGGRFDPRIGDYVFDRLDSPAIDAGDPSYDFTQEPLPNGSRINLGCFGGTDQASKSIETVTAAPANG